MPPVPALDNAQPSSVREVLNSGGAIVARYDYRPFGEVDTLTETVSSDFRYTGHFYHVPSGLHLTLYRAYDPAQGRWLSRDPIGELGGLNLYGYVGNNVVNFYDPFGESTDSYRPDATGHGQHPDGRPIDPHIDRITKTDKKVGRYKPDGTPIPSGGRIPPPIPNSDKKAFAEAAKKLLSRVGKLGGKIPGILGAFFDAQSYIDMMKPKDYQKYKVPYDENGNPLPDGETREIIIYCGPGSMI